MQHPNLLLSTTNHKAFQHVTSGLNHLEAYKKSKKWDEVTAAADELDAAVAMDPGYTAARYYAGIADDLAGRAADGADVLAPLLSQQLDGKFQQYVRYALAVAEYHQYHGPNLATAARLLDELLAASPDYAVVASSYALLAQVRAMQEIPKRSRETDMTRSPVDDVRSMSARSADAASRAEALLSAPEASALEPQLRTQLDAMIRNARGMSEMYRADYEEQGRLERLDRALEHLEAVDRATPRDWANTSDLGSVHMRFGIFRSEPGQFDEARRYLLDVVETLRPNYGFALYEIGRTYRVQGLFQDALQWYDRALQVKERYRDVRDGTIEREKELARNWSQQYP